ncbi:MAG: hypothetical protein LBC84_08605 [Prevotellaceae bacterium]|jgi:hypothetical protein|nr:hypothetical protein [Prevotellaceae bacterium]
MRDDFENDAFGALFHQKLTDHPILIPESGWDMIKSRLTRPKRRTMVWIGWGEALAAAVLIVLFLILNRQAVEKDTITLSVLQKSVDLTPIQEVILLPQDQIQIKESVSTCPSKSTPQSEFQPPPESLSQPESPTQPEPPSQPDTELSPQPIPESPPKSEPKSVDRSWLLAAAFGTNGGRSQINSSGGASVRGSLLYANDFSSTVYSSARLEMEQDDCTHIRHYPPISFGLQVRKNIGKKIDIESGIIYTYLASQFTWEGSQAHQSLHYIGIPVNVVSPIWTSPSKWKAYSSAGFAIEKGVRAIFVQTINKENTRLATVTTKGPIHGVQWSINGALGVNYYIGNSFGLYFEPRIGYHFKGNQPISMRTQRPLSYGVNLGLCYQL